MNKNFQAWFDKSKVVDRRDQPILVYHGTPDKRFIKATGLFQSQKEQYGKADPERAFFFASNREVAQTYADEHRAFDYQEAEGGVISAYLSIQNPMVIDNEGERWRGTVERIAEAREQGHDGAIILNTIDDYNTTQESRETTVFVVFDPKQINVVED